MSFGNVLRYYTIFFVSLIVVCECSTNVSETEYPLVYESLSVAKNIFDQGRNNYDLIKKKSFEAVDMFLDIVSVINEEMAKEVRSAIIKFYKLKFFLDFTSYVISMEEMVEITEHCLADTLGIIVDVRRQFHQVIQNFEDIRNFQLVEKCRDQLPDEVATAHCMLHQAVLFNVTMQENLLNIVNIKTKNHAQDVNNTLFEVQHCFTDFVPNFFDNLLIDSYKETSSYLKIVNTSISDLVYGKWKKTETHFPQKWRPLVKILQERQSKRQEEPLVLSLFEANLTLPEVMKALY